MQDDRVDATTRGFLGLTVACAQCHDHKFDPIPQSRFLLAAGRLPQHRRPRRFRWRPRTSWKSGTRRRRRWTNRKRTEGVHRRSKPSNWRGSWRRRRRATCWRRASLGAGRTIWIAETLDALEEIPGGTRKAAPLSEGLVELPPRNAPREEMEAAAREFQAQVETSTRKSTVIDENNKIRLGLNPDRDAMSQADLESLADRQVQPLGRHARRGVLHYTGDEARPLPERRVDRPPEQLARATGGAEEGTAAAYPVPADACRTRRNRRISHVAIRGDVNNRGDVAPPHLPSILCDGAPQPFPQGQRAAGTGGRNRQRATIR